jgi:hypothetical protein
MEHVNYDELPVILKPKDVQKVLGWRINDVYKLFRSKKFPSEKIGQRYIIPKPRFLKWLGINGTKEENIC